MRHIRTLLSAVAITVTTTAAHAAVYTQNFDAFVDGTTVLGDGSTISSNNGTNSVQSGALRMTQDGVGSTISSLRMPSLSGSAAGWMASFDFFLSDEAGANLPADGFSFNYGAIPALTNPGFFNGSGEGRGEEGFNELGEAFANLSFELDTWANGFAKLRRLRGWHHSSRRRLDDQQQQRHEQRTERCVANDPGRGGVHHLVAPHAFAFRVRRRLDGQL